MSIEAISRMAVSFGRLERARPQTPLRGALFG